MIYVFVFAVLFVAGIYIIDFFKAAGKKDSFYWTCSFCGGLTIVECTFCAHCGHERTDTVSQKTGPALVMIAKMRERLNTH